MQPDYTSQLWLGCCQRSLLQAALLWHFPMLLILKPLGYESAALKVCPNSSCSYGDSWDRGIVQPASQMTRGPDLQNLQTLT